MDIYHKAALPKLVGRIKEITPFDFSLITARQLISSERLIIRRAHTGSTHNTFGLMQSLLLKDTPLRTYLSLLERYELVLCAFQNRFQLVMSSLADHIRRRYQRAVCVFNFFLRFFFHQYVDSTSTQFVMM